MVPRLSPNKCNCPVVTSTFACCMPLRFSQDLFIHYVLGFLKVNQNEIVDNR